MIDKFMNPEAFFLLFLPAGYLVLRAVSGKGFRFTSLQIVKRIKPSLKQRMAIIPDIILYLVFVLIVIAMARPQIILDQTFNITEGVAMEIVIDRSSSMSDEMVYDNSWKSKLDIVKTLFIEFVNGNGKDLAGRPMDLIGLIHFARFPETAMPLSLEHSILTDYLQYIQVAKTPAEDGTAIGDAVLLSASRLRQYEEYLQSEKDYAIKSKVIILLTDGENTAGTISPAEAARKAAAWGIKIYSVAINSEKLSRTFTDFNRTIRNMLPTRRIDERFLGEMSDITGGKYWIARDSENLREIYQEIDKLEKSKMKLNEYSETREFFQFFIMAAFAGLIIYILARSLIFRRMEV